jgi:hypothetical protein
MKIQRFNHLGTTINFIKVKALQVEIMFILFTLLEEQIRYDEI